MGDRTEREELPGTTVLGCSPDPASRVRSWFGERWAVWAPALLLLRALLPAWRFFDDIEEAQVLMYRIEETSGKLGPWKRCLRRPPRTLGSLFTNAEGNLFLACGSVVEQLVEQLAEHMVEQLAAEGAEVCRTRTWDLRSCSSYKLTRRMVQDRIRNSHTGPPPRYQFKVEVRPLGSSEKPYDVLVSPLYEPS
ncbi:MAG: hypothetical protein V3V08_21805 [Nannocystaceae bacterium]